MDFTSFGWPFLFVFLLNSLSSDGESNIAPVDSTLATLTNVSHLVFPKLYFLILPGTGCIFRFSIFETATLVPKYIYANLRKTFVDMYVVARHVVAEFRRRKKWYYYQYTGEVLEMGDIFFGRCTFLRKDVRDRKHYVDLPFLIKMTNTTPYRKHKNFKPLRTYTPKYIRKFLEKMDRKGGYKKITYPWFPIDHYG